VAALAAKTLKTTATPAQLLEHVKADVPANSQILRIRYQDTVPLTAQRGAHAFAKAYLTSREADARSQATISQKSLQSDITRFQKQATAAEKVIGDPDADSAPRHSPRARWSPPPACPPPRPAPTTASTSASACSLGSSSGSCWPSSATAPTTG